MKLVIILLSFGALLSAQSTAQQDPKPAADDIYGLHLGTVGGSATFGVMHETYIRGIHPAIEGGFDIGLHRYLGLFGQASYSHMSATQSACYGYYCASAGAKLDYYELGGGLELVASNHSRVVPYARFGAAYVGASATGYVTGGGYLAAGSGYASAPAVLMGWGARAYVNHNFGIDARLTALRVISRYGNSSIFTPTVGVFFQSK